MNEVDKRDKKWKKDPEYILYCNSGEATAVYIVRDLCSDVDSKSKWIDCIAINAWKDRNSWKFKYIVVELFPRRIMPKYGEDEAYNKYITWKTAHEDIAQQRKEGVKGPIFLVKCWLIDKNAGKFSVEYQLYDEKEKCWIADPALRTDTCVEREKRYPLEPEWGYRIDEVKQITSKQAQIYKKKKQ